jgi:hypothetical protein
VQRNRRRIVIGAAAVAVVAAAVTAVVAWPHAHHRSAPAVVALPQPPEPVAVVTPTPTPTPTKPAIEHVAAAAPTGFRISGPAFTVDAHVCGMRYVRPLDPPGDQLHTVCWVEEGFGVAPGSPSAGTTYVLGHAWAEQKLVLNPLSEFATANASATPSMLPPGVPVFEVKALNGYGVELDTPQGRLAYRVTDAFLVSKEQAGSVQSVMAANTPNRVVIITCAVKNGVDLDQNVIAYATLVGAAART